MSAERFGAATITTFRTARIPDDAPALARVGVEYLAWLSTGLRDDSGLDLPVPRTSEVVSAVSGFVQDGGVVLLAERDLRLVAVGGLRMLETGVADVRRLYVPADLQRQGLGSIVLDNLVWTARYTMNAHTIRMDVCRFMNHAQRLCERHGFYRRYPDESTAVPRKLWRYWQFYEKNITGRAWTSGSRGQLPREIPATAPRFAPAPRAGDR